MTDGINDNGKKGAVPNEAREEKSHPNKDTQIAAMESGDREPGNGRGRAAPSEAGHENGADRQTFLKNKPYEFLPLLETRKEIQRYSHQDMAVETYSGKLKLNITALSPLHIGSKQKEYDAFGNAKKKQMRRNGSIIIPGSSIKGAVRSIAEAVSYSCAVKPPSGQLRKLLPVKNKLPCSNPKSKGICITCSIFGMAGEMGKKGKKDEEEGKSKKEDAKESYKGKVVFGEFTWIKGGAGAQTVYAKLPRLESPFKDYPNPHDVFGKSDTKNQYRYGNERLYYCKACNTGDCQNCSKQEYFQKRDKAGEEREMAFRGRKFYSIKREISAESILEINGGKRGNDFEMVSPGSVFSGEVLFQNLTEEEARLLAYSLGIGHHFTMKIGYGKPLGYGKIKVDLLDVEDMRDRYNLGLVGAEGMRSQCNLQGTVLDKEKVERWAKEYHDSSQADIKAAIDELERIMKVTNEESSKDRPEEKINNLEGQIDKLEG